MSLRLYTSTSEYMTLIHFIKRGLVSAVLTMAAAIPATAIDLPVTTVNGKDYYYYDVQPKETIFSLSQRLGISREEIISYNPGVDGGLKAYTRLYFPVESGLSAIADGDHVTTTHDVKKGETLYGVAKKYGISVDRLIALNPSARDGIKSGDRLVIMQENAESPQPVTHVSHTGGTHTISQGETLYRIAVNNGITVEQLLAANPELDAYNYSEGIVINIPEGSAEPHATPHVAETEAPQHAASKPESTPATQNIAENSDEATADTASHNPTPTADIADVTDTPYNIAIMLPFRLDDEKIGKDAENFTEFYRGFLLAAQNLCNSGRHVNINAYDTRGNLDTVKELMARDEMAQVDMFVAPASAAELDYIISQADSDRQFVFNTFAVRSSSWQTNSNVLQANIPHSMMYQRAIDAFINEMDGRIPVFVQRIGATADKEEFTSMLKSQLSDRGIAFKEITFETTLKDEDFAGYDTGGSYVIVPLSSSAAEFNKIAPGAKRFKESLGSETALTIFGYPEWLTFRGERKENLGALNAVIYSRFYYDDTYYPAKRFADTYRQAYGRDMNSAVPSQAIMGYDVANFIIKSMRANNGDFHSKVAPVEGLQTDFIFSDSNCEGLVNTSVELIKFKDGGFTEHRNI